MPQTFCSPYSCHSFLLPASLFPSFSCIVILHFNGQFNLSGALGGSLISRCATPINSIAPDNQGTVSLPSSLSSALCFALVQGPGSIPGWERSPGEGIGYPLQCCWAFLMAQLVKNTPAMWETWVRPLGWEDPVEKGKATHSSI